MYLPGAVVDCTVLVEMHQFVGHSYGMDSSLLLVREDGVGYPDFLYEFLVQFQTTDVGHVGERQAGIRPFLS